MKAKAKNGKPFFFAVAAVTMDGFIARYSGHFSDWTTKEDKDHLHKMEAKADALFLGRKTFEIAKQKISKFNCIVLSSKAKGVERKGNAIFFNPKKNSLQKILKENGFEKICVLGGRGAYNYCLKNNLLDEIFLTIEPVLFGNGITMFDKSVKTRDFSLVSVKKLNKNGTILLHYKKG